MRFVRAFRDETRSYRGRPLKVLMFNESLTGGGCERNLVELATHYDPAVVEAVVGIYHDDRHYVTRLEEAGVRWWLEPKAGKVDLGFLARLAGRVRKERPDVIHSFLPTPNFWIKLARMGAGRPPLVIFLGSIEPTTKDFLLDRALRRSIAAVIVNSTTARDEAIHHFGFPPERVHLIYNGVDLDAFSPGAPPEGLRAELGVPEDALLLTVVARVRGEKNHACLVRALKALEGDGRLPAHVHGRFLGRLADPALVEHLKAELAASGLAARFTFTGPRGDIADVLRASDLLVLPSLFEGCPNAVQEALAAGLPVIASAVSDNAKLVHEGKNGFLFPSDDHEALAEALLNVFDASPQARREMGAAGRRIAEANFAMSTYVRQTLNVYHRAMGRAGA